VHAAGLYRQIEVYFVLCAYRRCFESKILQWGSERRGGRADEGTGLGNERSPERVSLGGARDDLLGLEVGVGKQFNRRALVLLAALPAKASLLGRLVLREGLTGGELPELSDWTPRAVPGARSGRWDVAVVAVGAREGP